ncbi:MAG: hypothetical protein K0R18_2 [Bacillales bacterium]|nr:hypothetical protein [Bacillales bacterium]
MKLGKEVYFHSEKGIHKGYIEKINKNTINVIVDDENKVEGFQLWRVEEFFLCDSTELAVERWEDYKFRLRETYRLINARRKMYDFYRGLTVIVEPFNKIPYSGTILRVCKASVEMVTDNGKFMKVDKSLCVPKHVYGGFYES